MVEREVVKLQEELEQLESVNTGNSLARFGKDVPVPSP